MELGMEPMTSTIRGGDDADGDGDPSAVHERAIRVAACGIGAEHVGEHAADQGEPTVLAAPASTWPVE